MIGSPANVPQALDQFFLPQLRVQEMMFELAKLPEYTSYTKFVKMDDPAGDVIYHIYSEPLAAMPEWNGPRHMSEVDFRYWTSTVKTFADSMKVDVDDIKPDSGSPAKMMAYQQAAQRLVGGAMLTWPNLVKQAIQDGVTNVWVPDGQKIFDVHPVNPSDAAGDTFRNYFANTVQGGGAAKAISYVNELAALKHGYTFKAPNDYDMPIRYNMCVTAPSNVPLLSRLLKDERIPALEAGGTTAAGGDVLNEIRRYYGGDSIEVVGLANFPSNLRLYVDTTVPSEISLRLKERQPITWQYQGPGGPSGAFPIGSDEGMVSEAVFDTNSVKYGPKARGQAYFSNWWRVLLLDSTP